MAMKRSNAINTVIQDEIVLVAYKKNTVKRQCKSDGPMNISQKMPFCFSTVNNRYKFSVMANARSKFMITKFLSEPHNTTMIIILFARRPAMQIVTVIIVETGIVDPVRLYFGTSDSLVKKNELFETTLLSIMVHISFEYVF